MNLIPPTREFLDSYRAALAEFDAHRVTGFWRHFGQVDDFDGPESYLASIRLYQHQCGDPHGSVPASVFWLVDGDHFIGHASIRHRINPGLEPRGGHIGYAVRPSKWRLGYGSKILELAIPRMRELGIAEALITCDKVNAASRRIIEKNGGRPIDEVVVNGKPVLRYLLRL